MTEQLYRRRAGEPVQVWRVGDGEPPEWVGDAARTHGMAGDRVVKGIPVMFSAARFERIYEPLPAPAPDAREALEKALGLALAMLFPNEPPDSRAVSDEFVAMAAVQCDCWNSDCIKVIDAALARIGGGA